jgi:hypothetical protein
MKTYDKVTRYKVKRQYYLDFYYEIYKKGIFGWRRVGRYDTMEQASNWIKCQCDDDVYFNEKGNITDDRRI